MAVRVSLIVIDGCDEDTEKLRLEQRAGQSKVQGTLFSARFF